MANVSQLLAAADAARGWQSGRSGTTSAARRSADDPRQDVGLAYLRRGQGKWLRHGGRKLPSRSIHRAMNRRAPNPLTTTWGWPIRQRRPAGRRSQFPPGLALDPEFAEGT